MTGLDKILKVIGDDAQAKSDAIIAKANKEADDILQAAKIDAEKKTAQIAEKSASEVNDIIYRAESAAILQERKILLEAKHQIIDDVITKAKQSLNALSDSEFTDIILGMISKYAHNKEGKIMFSATDRRRLPLNMNERIKSVLIQKPGATLIVMEQSAEIDGGFILIYGDIEENCSYDALFESMKDSLQDKVYSFLFD